MSWIYIRLPKANSLLQKANPCLQIRICVFIKRIRVICQKANLRFEICVCLSQICVFKFVFYPNLCFQIHEIQKGKSQLRNTNALFFKTRIRVSKRKSVFQKANLLYFLEICVLWNLCFGNYKFPLVMRR